MENITSTSNMGESSADRKKYHGHTLKEILETHDSDCLQAFREYLVHEYCDENLDFWLDVDDYKHLNSSQSRARTAKRIHRMYIADKAPREINSDKKMKEAISKKIESAEENIFDEAQRDVFYLMLKGPFIRFVQKEKVESL